MTDDKRYRITLEESHAKAAELAEDGFDIYWFYAGNSGWYLPEFLNLYKAYIKSTSIELSSHDDGTKLKGRPLEKIAFYFLKNGGIVTDIRELGAHQRWQVDGQGELNKSSLVVCMGEKWCKDAGFQLYMEAKNHKAPMTGVEFSSHYERMNNHHCSVGLCVSTGGYKISAGKGIAERVHLNTWKNQFHFLMTIEGLYKVAKEKIAPISIFQEMLGYAVNDRYANDKVLQRRYSQNYCLNLAQSEYHRLFS